MIKVEVKVNSPYSVLIKSGALARLGEELKKVTRANKVLVVTDTNVQGLYLERAVQSLIEAGYEVHSFAFVAGEQSKTAETYLNIISALGEHGFKRTDAVVALGGGVVGDIAGFAAATYMRGIDVVQVPTTLLAMIDSSIGGKTGVDLQYGKNLLGAFHQPKLVLADITLLDTLPQKEWANGIGEGIKYACLSGGRIYDIMKDGLDKDNLEEFVALCAEYKAVVVSKDEKEGGLRKLLNLGHTVGHAIEKQSNFEIAHGVAVAEGIGIMASAAHRSGELSKGDCHRIRELLSKYGL
ncbi:MAG: 3-dehydroquinate synthase, partial [Clostridia bacterium]|nr:3-dehydroquinate synthase [Clostridia bacterium]